jgi:hypothetical protein
MLPSWGLVLRRKRHPIHEPTPPLGHACSGSERCDRWNDPLGQCEPQLALAARAFDPSDRLTQVLGFEVRVDRGRQLRIAVTENSLRLDQRHPRAREPRSPPKAGSRRGRSCGRRRWSLTSWAGTSGCSRIARTPNSEPCRPAIPFGRMS